MKNEQLKNWGLDALLAFLISWGGVRAMITGLNLTVSGLGRMMLILLLLSLALSAVGRLRFGNWILLGMCLLPLLPLLRAGSLWEQTSAMLWRIFKYYDNAYRWGIPEIFRQNNIPVNYPLVVIGLWVAAANIRSFTHDGGSWRALLFSALPLILCVVVTDTVPDNTSLFFWLLGLAPVLLSRELRNQDPRAARRMTCLALLPTALALALLFHAVPREDYHMQPDFLQDKAKEVFQDTIDQVGQSLEGALAGADQPETIRLSALGPRITTDTEVMEVISPVGGTLYLRGRYYDTYSGLGWTNSSTEMEVEMPPRLATYEGQLIIRTRRVRDVLYTPYYTDENLILQEGAVENSEKLRDYTCELRSLDSYWKDLMVAFPNAGEGIELDPGRWLQLPEETRTWARWQCSEILSSEYTATDKAETIARFVRNSARYYRNTSRMPSDETDFARWFLEDSNTGYCVHFATATVVLLRAAGVEARYAEGYSFTANQAEPVTVTADQAHAWAEYYEPMLGVWIPLEATPADENDPDPHPPSTGEPEIPTETAADSPEQEPQQPEEPEKPQKEQKFPWLLLILLLLLAATEGQRRLRLMLWNRRFREGSRNRKTLLIWVRLEQLCRLTETSPSGHALDIARKARYSRQGVSELELRSMQQEFSAARGALESLNLEKRLKARYIFALL